VRVKPQTKLPCASVHINPNVKRSTTTLHNMSTAIIIHETAKFSFASTESLLNAWFRNWLWWQRSLSSKASKALKPQLELEPLASSNFLRT